jgi:D-alanyl-D-alanine carboxypeptidase
VGAQSAKRAESLDAVRSRVQAKLDELRAAASFPGATVAFVLPDGRSATVASGVSPEARMPAGSIGKTWFAALAMRLVEEGKLDLDAKIERYIGREPWFGRLPNAKAITVRMLLNHTSGISEHVLDPAFLAEIRKSPDRVWKPAELVSYVLDKAPLFEAGKGWSYADTNYIVLGIVLERVTGRSLYDDVERLYLDPLKLEATVPAVSRRIPGVVSGTSRQGSPFGFEGPTVVDGAFVFNPQMEWTGGGFVSSAEDLARWARALYGGDVLRKASLATMVEAVDAKTGPGDKYGLGVQVRQSPWGVTYGHGGWFPGYLSEMEYIPQERIAVAIQFNTDDFRAIKRHPRAYLADVVRAITAQP